MAKLEEAACLPRRRQNRREHRPEQLSDGPTAFSFHAAVFIPQPRSDVRAHHCADPYRWSDLSPCIGPFLRCDGEEQDHIHSHFFCRPAWSRVEVGRLTHKERAWAERRLTGRITELNQRMGRVTQRLNFETSRCAPVSSRPNSSLVAAHCVRTRTDLRTCVDILLYAMGRLQLCMPRRLDRYAQAAH